MSPRFMDEFAGSGGVEFCTEPHPVPLDGLNREAHVFGHLVASLSGGHELKNSLFLRGYFHFVVKGLHNSCIFTHTKFALSKEKNTKLKFRNSVVTGNFRPQIR